MAHQQVGIVISLRVRLKTRKASTKQSSQNEGANLLRVEQTPVTLNATELLVLPGLVEVLEEEVAGAVVVSLADEGVQERLEVRLRSGRGAVALIADVAGCL